MKRSLRSWLWRVPLDQEIDEELTFHIEMRTRELVDKGLDAKVAREVVLARIGDTGRLRRTCIDLGRKRDRDMRAIQWFEEFRDDVRYALRQLKAAPGFATVAVITLALGIGANSAMFALADTTLLRPLPFPEPDQLVTLSEIRANGSRLPANPLDFEDWEARAGAFSAIAAVTRGSSSITGPDGAAEEIPSQAVTTRFFDVLGVRPIAGRTFLEADEGPAPDVVVMSEAFWRTRFGADPTLVGRATRLGGRMFTVIGIVPADFTFELPGTTTGGQSSVWTLLNPPRSRAPAERHPHYLNVIGRLKPGIALEAARADIGAVAESLALESPATNKGHGATADPLRERVIGGELRLTAMLLLGVVGLVLLMCCANVANLLLARASSRAREFVVRAALGAGRWRIVRQLLSESFVLATFGAAVGAAIGAGILRAAPSLVPPGLLPASLVLEFDWRVLLFCVAGSFVVAILYGLAPVWLATDASPTQAMATGGRSTTGSSAGVRRLLATSQVAVAVLLLCGAGLLLRTLLVLENVDPGSRAGDLLTMIVSGGGPGRDRTPESMRRTYEAYEREAASVPGVRAVAWGSVMPLAGQWYGQTFQIEGDAPRPQGDRDATDYFIVSPSYFRLLGIPLRQGRALVDSDTAESPQVCLVDEAFVRRYLQGRNPLETHLAINNMGPPGVVTRQIVGVVGHVKERPDEPEPEPQVYVPLAQNTWWDATLVVQPVRGQAATLAPAVRAALARVDRERPVRMVRTLTAIADDATARPRFRTLVIGTFAVLALTLAMVGVFGVLAYSVQQRTREFGVRIAVGASAAHVLRLVLSSAGRVMVTGIAVGLGMAAVLSRSISTFLFGVQPQDPLTFLLVPVVLAATAAIAVAVPAIRAMRVDPVVAFRGD
jgi:putative ABC transport system permease protein